MSDFRVTLSSSKQIAAITYDGFVAKQAHFRVQRLSDRRTYSYEGHGGGKQFEMRCRLMLAAGGILVSASDSPTNPPELSWIEGVVNKALEQAEQLQ